jgi:hypothetical protein
MPLLAPDILAENLHETNARLGLLLDSLIGDGGQPRPATPQQMAGFLSELMRAGQWLRGLPPEKDSAVELEVSLYRGNVERLRTLLPSIHDALLRERSRLEQERARMQSAANWANGSRQTL